MNKRSLFLEHLEARQLFAAGISYEGGILKIVGTKSPDNISVGLYDNSDNAFGQVYVNGREHDIDQPVTGIQVDGLDGSDNISVSAVINFDNDTDSDSEFESNLITVAVTGGNGNDQIAVSSDQAIFVNSGNGNDDVRIDGSGPAEVFGAAGNDFISIQGYVSGTDDSDSIVYGGDGNDTIFSGGTRSHTIDGGTGHNLLYGSGGSTYFYVGASPQGRDTISGGSGDDVVFARGLGYIKFSSGGYGDDEFVVSRRLKQRRDAIPGLTVLGRDIEIVIQ